MRHARELLTIESSRSRPTEPPLRWAPGALGAPGARRHWRQSLVEVPIPTQVKDCNRYDAPTIVSTPTATGQRRFVESHDRGGSAYGSVSKRGKPAMGTKRLHYSENFSEEAADFTLLSLPEPLLATLVEQDGGCASSIAV